MNLSTYTNAQLVAAFNLATGRDIKRFENRQIAEKRVACIFQTGPLDIDTVLGLTGETPKTEEVPAVAKPIHAADAAAAAIVAGAVSYNVHMRLSPRSKINEPAANEVEAAAIAARLENKHPTKRAMIYAIDASGASALVTREAPKAAPTAELKVSETGIATDAEVPAFLLKGRVSGAVAEVVPEAAPAPVKPARVRKDKPAKAEGSTRTRRDLSATIAAVVANPKKPGSRSFFRFELYKAGATIGEFIAACVAAGYPESEAKADISWDSRKGFIKIADAA